MGMLGRTALAVSCLALELVVPRLGVAATDADGNLARRRLGPAPGVTRTLPPARPKGNFRVGLDARNAYDDDGIFWDGAETEEFRALLEAHGATLVELPAFEAADLDGLQALVIGQPYERSGVGYSASEIAAIQAFVAGGGRVLVCAEGGSGGDARVPNLNELVAPWGVTFASSPSDPTGHVITTFESHPVTAGVTRFGLDYLRRLTAIAPPAFDLTPGAGSDDSLAVVDAGPDQGCVMIVSDQSCFRDTDAGADYPLGALDNALLLGNVIDWFQSSACGELAPCEATAVVEGPTELCEGDFFELTGAASSIPTCTGPVEYRWLKDDVEIVPWSVAPLFSDFADADATYRLEIRCAVDPACQDRVDHAVTVEPDVPPPALPNVLLAGKQDDGILFAWDDTGVFAHRLRRHVDAAFDRATSEEVGTLSDVQLLVPGELSRSPWLLFYRVFGVNCAGTEEE